jgi:hypothetical protein
LLWANSGNSGYGLAGLAFFIFLTPGVVAGVVKGNPDAQII